MSMQRVRDWTSFWDQPHSIYVSARHFDVHYRDVAEGIIRLLPSSATRVLDYGCGEAIHADLVAAKAASLTLCEAAPSVRDKLKARFGGNARIGVLAPEEVERLADGAFDLIVANSLVQYLSAAELDRLLELWRRLLAPDGVLVVADVIPPDAGVVTDIVALLRYAAKNGFLGAAMLGIVRTALSPYPRMRAELGLACYTQAQFADILAAHGFTAEPLGFNLEHNPARLSFRARKMSTTGNKQF